MKHAEAIERLRQVYGLMESWERLRKDLEPYERLGLIDRPRIPLDSAIEQLAKVAVYPH